MCSKCQAKNEPPHDKINKMTLRPAKTQISLGIRPVGWTVFTVRMKKAWVLNYPLSAQQRLWSDWADAQADLSLRWVHSHFVGFVMSWLTSLSKQWKDVWQFHFNKVSLFTFWYLQQRVKTVKSDVCWNNETTGDHRYFVFSPEQSKRAF